MNKTSNLITIKVEGFDSENGHVRADEFVGELERLLTVLNGVDKLVGSTSQPTLYYRIVAVADNGTLSVTLEPVIKPNVRKPNKDLIVMRHHRFFDELKAIQTNRPVSPEMDERLLENLLDLTGSENQTFKSVTIQNGESKINLDKDFEQNLKKMLGEYDASYGGVEGKLDKANIHGFARRFWIYPTIGAQKIRCDFLPGTSEQIRAALGSYVRVEGLKHFRPQSPYPFRISVKELIIFDDEKTSLKELRGIAEGSLKGLSSVEFVRKIRNEWD